MRKGADSRRRVVAPPRVYAYVVRDGRVAVFAHEDPDAGLQVPGGGVEPDESLEAAVCREVLEESGLRCRVVADLGETRRLGWAPGVGALESVRRMFHLEPVGDVPESWTWTERHASDGGVYEFAFRWLPIAEAATALDFGFGARLDALAPVSGGPSPAGRMLQAGYDRLATRYPEWSRENAATTGSGNVRHRMIARALSLGGVGPALDIGCGTGELATAHLVHLGLDVVGVDLSPVSIERAAATISGAEFVAADVTALSLPLRHFGLVFAGNSVIHVPRERHAALFRDVHRWLHPGGVFALNVEPEGAAGAGTAQPWIDGVEMFWSGWTLVEEIALLERAGFEMVEVDDASDPSGPFTWLFCRRVA